MICEPKAASDKFCRDPPHDFTFALPLERRFQAGNLTASHRRCGKPPREGDISKKHPRSRLQGRQKIPIWATFFV
jgi:hypothetical protein